MRLPDKNPAKTNANVMSEQSRKVLEDIQRAKSKLLKDGAAASLGINYAPSPIVNTNNHFNNPVTGGFSDVHLSPLQRSAMQVLQQANSTSFGFFVSQDSHFGNSILPVLPRIDNPNPTNANANANNVNIPTAVIKSEK